MGTVEQTFVENESKGKLLKAHCHICNRKTRHEVKQSVDETGTEVFDDEFSIDWVNSYQIIQCQGCEVISFRHQTWFSEDQQWYGPNDFDDGTKEFLYPKRSDKTLPCGDMLNVPTVLRRIYRETIDAYNQESFTLCAAGLRAIVEGVCADQGITDGPVTVTKKDGTSKTVRNKNLEGKILGLHEKGILTQKSSDVLHEHRFLGNEAVHELSQPSQRELVLAIEIVEHMLESLYEIPEKARDLKIQKAKRLKGKP